MPILGFFFWQGTAISSNPWAQALPCASPFALQVADWLDQYHVVNASKLIQSCSLLHDRVQEMVEGQTATAALDVSVSTNCILLDHILRLLVRLQPQCADIVCQVRDELYASIFITPPETFKDFIMSSAHTSIDLDVGAAQLAATTLTAQGPSHPLSLPPSLPPRSTVGEHARQEQRYQKQTSHLTRGVRSAFFTFFSFWAGPLVYVQEETF